MPRALDCLKPMVAQRASPTGRYVSAVRANSAVLVETPNSRAARPACERKNARENLRTALAIK